MNNPIKIPLSKNKLIIKTIGVAIFVLAGCFLIVFSDLYKDFSIKFLRNPLVIQGIGVICILFFGAIGIYAIRKIYDEKLGLIIDSQGVTGNTNASSIGFINWNDISEIELKQVTSTKFILINVLNPETYIKRAESKMKAKLMRSNLKLCGTPIAITATTLKYNIGELEQLLQTEFNRHKKLKF
ncbi:STM3941 family protein [Psychroserpens damuponensis]|uniref:STM3941 family protein n=1 Tax=Psychroserpens damuponensis TaxID=943936 RepID=UPI00058B5EE1|nr:STM3941 family protein [Psychroserpens damuponensis]